MSELYFSDEFTKFSQEVARLKDLKTQKKDEFKKIHAAFQASITEIDTEVQTLVSNWESFKALPKKS